MPPNAHRSWVEVTSDGDGPTTKVVLVVEGPTGQLRYVIPGVRALTWSVPGPREDARLTMDLTGVRGEVRARIRSSDTDVATLLSEIAAGELVKDKTGDDQ